MPFKKITEGPDRGKYRSPSGRVMIYGQVQAYYANNPKPKKNIRQENKVMPPKEEDKGKT